ncbi:NAD(P)-dependent alcohol dehydrogenase [Gottfriedia acidiceleris]|uniref:NAD(P)-dependent alcohol dehydrogenase n=1 Tax=Gottfriedia acidiceleris TaxID=371036 RepID=UPI002FFE49CF
MKAMIYSGKGSQQESLKIADTSLPKPKSNQVLVRIEASSLNIIDFERFRIPMKPSIFAHVIKFFQGRKGFSLGGEFSGSIVEVGGNVESFQIGEKVFGSTLGVMPKGAWAEYALCDKNNIAYKPHNLTDSQAAVLPLSGIAALAGVEKAKIRKGDKVLIYGASGGVGLYVLQLVKAKDAQITAVCSSRNIELVKSYGVDSVIDYRSEDFTKCGKLFDKIISVNGYNPVKTYKNLLKENGVYVAVGNAKQMFHAMFASCLNPISNRKVLFSSSAIPSSDSQLSSIKEMAEQGLLTPHIDKIYSIREVSNAIDYVINQHTQGKVALKMDF